MRRVGSVGKFGWGCGRDHTLTGMKALPRAALSVLAQALLCLSAFAQDALPEELPSGELRRPEDEGLPWTYIVLVLVLIGVFFLLRRGRRPLPSERERRG